MVKKEKDKLQLVITRNINFVLLLFHHMEHGVELVKPGHYRGIGHGKATTVLTVPLFALSTPRESINALIWDLNFQNFPLSHHSPTSKLYFRWLTVPH